MQTKLVAAILCGGLGTRLRPLTYKTPKPLLKINKKPFLYYLLKKLQILGVKDVKLLVGYKSDQFEKFAKTLDLNLNVSIIKEKELLGTGGAIVNAFCNLNKTILVLNGDTYLDLNLKKFLEFHKKKKALISIYSLLGDLESRGAIEIDQNGLVKKFSEKQKKGIGIFNSGVYLIEPKAISILKNLVDLKKLPKNFSLEKDGFKIFVKNKTLFSFSANGYFIDIGTFESFFAAKYFFKSLESGKRAIFLDRDGVINKHRPDYVKSLDEFEFEENAILGLRLLSKLKISIFVITNQSPINRKIFDLNTLNKIHSYMLEVLKKNNIKIKKIYFCPHRPDENCSCRKPKPGMLFQAQKEFNIDLTKSYVIGDSKSDIILGNIVGAKTILIIKEKLKQKTKFKQIFEPFAYASDLVQAFQIIKNDLKKVPALQSQQ